MCEITFNLKMIPLFHYTTNNHYFTEQAIRGKILGFIIIVREEECSGNISRNGTSAYSQISIDPDAPWPFEVEERSKVTSSEGTEETTEEDPDRPKVWRTGVEVALKGDPGYAATSKMLVEGALCLADPA